MENSSKKSIFFSILKEIIIVLTGVLIALLINDWKETYDNNQYVKSVFTTVSNDITESQAEVNKIIEKHQKTIDSIAFYLEDNTQSIREILYKVGGLQSPSIKNISLRFLVANRADLLNYELISLLTEIEESADLLDKKVDKLIDFSYVNMENTDAKSKLMFSIYLSNVVDSEATLLQLYDSFLSDKTSNSQKINE